MSLRPGGVQVEVVGVAQHRGDLGAGRPGADLGHGHAAVRAAEPLHVGEPGVQPEGAQRGGRDPADAVVLGAADVAGQPHHPLHPRVPQHLKRRGQVVRDRVPDDLAVDHHAVVGAFLAGQELLDLRGPVRARAAPSPARPSGHRDRPGGTCSWPRPRGRLDHQREPHPAGEVGGRRRPSGPAGAGRRACPPPAAPSSSGPCPGSCGPCTGSMPPMPRCSRTWASGTWSCSSTASSR